MTSTEKRMGRPTKAAAPGERASLGLKVTASIKTRLEAAAQASGRTQIQEAEARIEQSFEDEASLTSALRVAYGDQVAGLVLLMGQALNDTGISCVPPTDLGKRKNWIADPYAFDQARKGVIRILDCARPQGEIVLPAFPSHNEAAAEIGRELVENTGSMIADELILAVNGERPKWQDAWLTQITSMLGPLAKRLKKGLKS